MDRPFAPFIVRVQFIHTLGDDTKVQNGFYLLYSGTPPTNANLVTFASDIAGFYNAVFSPLTDTETELTSVICTDLSSATAAQGTADVAFTGSRSGGQLPAAVCMLLNFSLARRYRGGKPKVFLPLGVDADLATPQTWESTFVASAVSAWNSVQSGIVGVPWSGAVIAGQYNLSYYSGTTVELYGTPQRARNVPTYRETPLANPISGVSGSVTLSSQRRRNRPGR